MDGDTSALEADWLGLCRRATEAVRARLAASPSTAERVLETGERGSGGDLTLVIDAAAESIVFGELERLHADGHRFSAISEERGNVDFGGGPVRVVIDPIDGSLNAKRRMPHYAISLAVACGPTIGDVAFGYVYDFGPGEEWWAKRGGGAWLDGARLDPLAPERRDAGGKLELLGIEAAEPELVRNAAERLIGRAYRLRVLGTIASALCQVAAARLDGLVTLRNCRSVDAAAGALIVTEAGGFVSFPRARNPPLGLELELGLELDPQSESPLVAARSESSLRELEQVPQ